jgi:hypothetical protein
MGSGSAQVEVYKLLGGQWRRAELSVQPGERIGRPDDRGGAMVDFGTDFYLVDVVEDLDSARSEGSSRERRIGMAVVASMSVPGMEIRIPADDLESADRMRLKEQADAAKGPAGTASADAPKGAGSGGAAPPKGPGSSGGAAPPKGPGAG